MLDDLTNRNTVLHSHEGRAFPVRRKGIAPALFRNVAWGIQVVYVAERYGIVADMTLEDTFLVCIPAFELVYGLDVFKVHVLLLPSFQI